jgi:predicted thioesterase
VSASNGIEEIGAGTHQRIVIDLVRSTSALPKK